MIATNQPEYQFWNPWSWGAATRSPVPRHPARQHNPSGDQSGFVALAPPTHLAALQKWTVNTCDVVLRQSKLTLALGQLLTTTGLGILLLLHLQWSSLFIPSLLFYAIPTLLGLGVALICLGAAGNNLHQYFFKSSINHLAKISNHTLPNPNLPIAANQGAANRNNPVVSVSLLRPFCVVDYSEQKFTNFMQVFIENSERLNEQIKPEFLKDQDLITEYLGESRAAMLAIKNILKSHSESQTIHKSIQKIPQEKTKKLVSLIAYQDENQHHLDALTKEECFFLFFYYVHDALVATCKELKDIQPIQEKTVVMAYIQKIKSSLGEATYRQKFKGVLDDSTVKQYLVGYVKELVENDSVTSRSWFPGGVWPMCAIF